MTRLDLLPLQAAIVLLLLAYCEIEGKDVHVTSSSSCGSFSLADYNEINIIYTGADLYGECAIEIEADSDPDHPKMCIDSSRLDVDDCSADVEVHSGFRYGSPDKEYSCSTGPYDTEYCTYLDSLTVVINRKSSYGSIDIKLRVYPKGSEFDIDLTGIAKSAVVGVYVIVGIVIGAIVLLIIVVIIVVCCCCKRQAASGTVYRNQQPAPQPAQGTYPQVQYQAVTPQAAGYQPPPPQGYQPPPQSYQPPPQGYQPPPQGYQPPPPQGYQPPPQGYSAPPPAQGYQTAEFQKMPSAPPPEKDAMASPPNPGQ